MNYVVIRISKESLGDNPIKTDRGYEAVVNGDRYIDINTAYQRRKSFSDSVSNREYEYIVEEEKQ